MKALALIIALAWCTSASAREQTELPSWLRVSVLDSKEVQLYFRALTASKWHVDGEDVFSPDFGADRRRIASGLSYLPGDWHFLGTSGATAPTAAMQISMPDELPYVVRVTLYCDGTDCDRFKRELGTMRSPRVTEDTHLVTAWREIVKSEPCDTLRPESRPPVRFPPEELRREITGEVTLSMFHNRCGDVRDATVGRSSGNRNLDRAAVNGVLRWRVMPRTANQPGWRSARVEFRLDDPSNPAVKAIDLESADIPGHQNSDVQDRAR